MSMKNIRKVIEYTLAMERHEFYKIRKHTESLNADVLYKAISMPVYNVVLNSYI